jgi:hypothetical protein
MWNVSGPALAVIVCASLALGAAGAWTAQGWRCRAKIAELEQQHRAQMLKGWEAAHKVNAEITEKFNEDLAAIANRPPPRPVLVCPSGGAVLPGAAAGAGAEGGAELPPAAGGSAQRDIGAFIASEADRADRCATQLNALIDWITKVRRPDR